MSDFLKTMAQRSAERAAAVTRFKSSDLDRPIVPLTHSSFDVIAEIKDHSPAEGELADGVTDRGVRARQYADGGAAAISVLTEPSRFAGDIKHLTEVVAAVPDTPVLRKDFLVDKVQILEARSAGASGVLLITTMLNDVVLRDMLDCAWEHGLFVLLESFDEDDLLRSSKLVENPADKDQAKRGQLMFGVNTRNLRTLEVDAERLRRLSHALPEARCVAESGLVKPEDAARVAGWGYSMALVGSALMRSEAPATLIKAMRNAGTVAADA